jgi:adenylate cyclase
MSGFGELLVSLGFVTEAQLEEAVAHQQFTGNRIGETLLALGYISRAQLLKVLSIASPESGDESAAERPRLGEILVENNALSQKRLDAVLGLQQIDPRPLGQLLLDHGDCTFQQVYEGLTAQSTVPSKHTRVMVVDDSAIVSAFVTDRLESLGYEVHAFEDPVVALERVEQVKPDIVVTDLDMPQMSGAELCRRLKRPTYNLPVIVLTANETERPLAALEAGADDYIRKGTPMDEVAARIDNIMKRTNATERMRRLFARYTSDAVVSQVLRDGDLVLTGEKREVTILFSDIRGFTSFAESHAPEIVMATLNDILGRLADAVLTCGGTVDKFLGDGLMAVFGAPVRRPDDARWAVTAARKMIESLAERTATAEHELEISIGINTGIVVAGSLGNERRTEYTCIGDAVNVASRLCAIAEPHQILLGEGTIRQLTDDAYEALPPVKLKGKANPVPVFRAKL